MTERTVAKQTRGLGFDDDSISITSTASEAYSSDQEFEVERVLAEKTQDGRKYYLVLWAGYLEEKSTWEPRKNIQDPAILDIWKGRKMQEEQKIVPAFDLTKFNEKMKKLKD
jgi:chromo domain-containing protein 1